MSNVTGPSVTGRAGVDSARGAVAGVESTAAVEVGAAASAGARADAGGGGTSVVGAEGADIEGARGEFER